MLDGARFIEILEQAEGNVDSLRLRNPAHILFASIPFHYTIKNRAS